MKQPDGAGTQGLTVWVRRQPNNWRIATYFLNTIKDVHWDRISGGVGANTIQHFLHTYVDCEAMINGDIAHSGIHGPCPHVIKVCLVKKDNDPAAFAQLVEMAGVKPKKEPSCAEAALSLTQEHGEIRGPELRSLLWLAGHSAFNIDRVLPKLVRQAKLQARRDGRMLVYSFPVG